MRRILLVMVLVAGLVAATEATAQPDSGTSVSATTFTIPLSGPGGTGTAFLAINPGGKVCYVIEVTLTTPGDVPQEPGPGIGNAHIHTFATGGIAVHLDSTFTALGNGMFIAADCVRGDKDVVRDVLANPEQYYVNIHTASFPAGAVSGALA
jgi:CHRD domain